MSDRINGEMTDREKVHRMSAEISSNILYHNHKETMAWAATAFYITGIVGLGLATRHINTCVLRSIVTSFIVLAAFLVYCFLHMQFKNRWEAVGYAEAFENAIIDWSAGEIPNKKEQEDWTVKKGDIYPKYIQSRIPSSRRFDADRWFTQTVSYVAIGAATLASLLILWLGRTA